MSPRNPAFLATYAFCLYKNGKREATLYPQKRRYANGQVMTEASIDWGLGRDLYVSLGEPLDNQGQAWAIRIYHKPLVRLIWLGALLMMAGGFLAASDPRYRRERKSVPASSEAQTMSGQASAGATA